MEKKETEKMTKRKRKNGSHREEMSFDKADEDIEHRSKRIHTSNSDLLMGVTMSEHQQEKMLDTVSGHIHELVSKEKRMTTDEAKTSKEAEVGSGLKSKKTRKRAKLSETENSVEESTIQGAGGSELPNGNTVAAAPSSVTQESALEYLCLWKEEREKWSFKKKTQYWLLQNMYDRTKVSLIT